MMIQLSDGCWVSADEIGEIKITPHSDRATVRTKSGIGHSIGADYGSSINETVDRLVAEINAARKEKP